jgi:hypothetical protein
MMNSLKSQFLADDDEEDVYDILPQSIAPSVAKIPVDEPRIYNKSVVIEDEQPLLPADEVLREKEAIWEAALEKTCRLHPHICQSWQYMAPELLHEIVWLNTGVTYDSVSYTHLTLPTTYC